MAKTAIIVGASGLVGSALLHEFSSHFHTVGTYCETETPNLVHLDLLDQRAVRSMLRNFRPNVVLCPAANPNVEFCEIDPNATWKVNVDGIRNLITATADIGAFFVYFSSEYVFDGTQGPYSEDDICNPLNEYGRQKLECERLIAAKLDRYIIGRISGVYNWEKQNKNFVVRLIESIQARLPFKVPSDQVITPTYGPSLSRIVRQLLDRDGHGVFHLAGSLPLLRSEFAYLVAEVFNLDNSFIVPVATSDLDLHAIRPRSAGLKTNKIRALLGCPIPGPHEGLEAMRKEMENRIELNSRYE